ncbi:uncharacterized protein LOC127846580 isoform X1 [Dreissena polymorpha]|uniref:Vitellogenin receptor n=1 Tax=Dreissena polymorpha TaxID=45954 RepID=A0A9D4DWZ3_DREPO|nr:uncharacterized protein LOC127846580 isoform X1 [Dreissena polymorpha]XP_052233965.1 uncharacterized protein LOC127846580 isoform X1 [Dreissena polymorpha]XP_052233966.1 uncharacterized protein LOC127846580 isoform X1 [Dreissena polymorpha]XP_052233967.1 uncharacterized protein LOC127846580 isoform X1 [Dreissena polymorpha]XP_052233968.1 uncharacterized protein LOC127846580 isoform X1 [Dreissena polymorpha]KAH3769013.1 hypothetical protein DPMN_170260 [Dreissena polymorpha]
MDVGVPDVQECARRFGVYQICSTTGPCVALNDTCPCLESSDFRCANSLCLSPHFRCDGKPDCPGGEDEVACPSIGHMVSERPHETSMAVIVTLATICALFCIVILVMIALFVVKKRKANISNDDNSGCAEPLRRSYITADTSSSDDDDKASRRIIRYYPIVPVCKENSCFEPCKKASVDNKLVTPERHVGPGEVYCENLTKDIKDVNKYLDVCAEIYGQTDKSRKVTRLGKYTFKPRLKYTNCNELLCRDKETKEKLYVINSYKHCAGKSIVPSTLTFDKDPDNFTAKFNKEFLCSSTPRQGTKQLSLTNISAISTDSIDV